MWTIFYYIVQPVTIPTNYAPRYWTDFKIISATPKCHRLLFFLEKNCNSTQPKNPKMSNFWKRRFYIDNPDFDILTPFCISVWGWGWCERSVFLYVLNDVHKRDRFLPEGSETCKNIDFHNSQIIWIIFGR